MSWNKAIIDRVIEEKSENIHSFELFWTQQNKYMQQFIESYNKLKSILDSYSTFLESFVSTTELQPVSLFKALK